MWRGLPRLPPDDAGDYGHENSGVDVARAQASQMKPCQPLPGSALTLWMGLGFLAAGCGGSTDFADVGPRASDAGIADAQVMVDGAAAQLTAW